MVQTEFLFGWALLSLGRDEGARMYANRYVHSNGTGTRNWSSNWPLGKSSGRIAKIAQWVPVIQNGKRINASPISREGSTMSSPLLSFRPPYVCTVQTLRFDNIEKISKLHSWVRFTSLNTWNPGFFELTLRNVFKSTMDKIKLLTIFKYLANFNVCFEYNIYYYIHIYEI